MNHNPKNTRKPANLRRPPRFTAAQVVEACEGSRGIVAVVARKLGCDRDTVIRASERWPEVRAALEGAKEHVVDLLEIKKKLPVDPEELFSFDFAHYVGLSIHQELELIQIPVENERLKYLIKHLNLFIPHVLEVNNIKEKAKLNGHIKYLKPPTF